MRYSSAKVKAVAALIFGLSVLSLSGPYADDSVTLVGAGDDSVTLVGAGDIADCTSVNDEATAKLLGEIPGTVFTTGDNAYKAGLPSEFDSCYEPSWGKHKDRTKPVPGNHEYKGGATPRGTSATSAKEPGNRAKVGIPTIWGSGT